MVESSVYIRLIVGSMALGLIYLLYREYKKI
jgi:hypothetical protein